MPRRRAAVAVALVAAIAPVWAAAAQVAPAQLTPPGASTTTTTTTAPPSGGDAPAPADPSPAPVAPPGGEPAPDDPDEPGGGQGEVPAGDGEGQAPAAARVVPPDAQALINSVPRSRANNTRRLLDAVGALTDFGLTEREAAVVGFGRFPVAGYATFSHDWWFPRFVPSFHLHEGTDIFAAAGTPVRAPTTGVVKRSNGPIGGLAVYVYQDDGTYFYMGHLSAFEEEAPDGARVEVGDVVGYVGDTGNAKGGTPHVHFEIHPAPTKQVTVGKGKERRTELQVTPVPIGTKLPPIDPKRYLDQWIDEAMGRVPELVAAYERTRPRLVLSTVLTRRFGPATPEALAGPDRPPRSQLLWATSANPTGGALALAEQEAARLARSVDWARHSVPIRYRPHR